MPGQEREKRKVLRRCILKTESDCEDVTWSGRSFCVGAGDWERPLKAAFHYSSQLQTWLKTWSQAGRKPAANLLKTGFFYIPFVQHAREPANSACCGSQPAGFRQKQSIKLVESVSQTRTNLLKTWLQTWSKTRFAARFLQLARIMECDLYRL